MPDPITWFWSTDEEKHRNVSLIRESPHSATLGTRIN